MPKNQKGFSHFIIPILLLMIVVIIGIFAFSRINYNAEGKVIFAAKNYGVVFKADSDSNYVYQYLLDINYTDSFDPKSQCHEKLNSFRGKLNIEYQSKSKAQVNVLQNVKPYQKKDYFYSAMPVSCPAVVGRAFTKTIRLDKKWVESSNAAKTVQINNKVYSLTLNKETRTIVFSGEDSKNVVPYLPDGLAKLYAYPMYDNCMSIAQIQAYAKQHSIVEADSKYPGLAASIKSTPNLLLQAPDGSKNVLIVIADDYVKQLVQKTRNERGLKENCRVVASKLVF